MAFQPEAAQVAIFAAFNHPGDSFADFVEGVAPLGSTARATLEGWLPSLLLSLFQALTLYSGLLEGLSRWEGAASQTEVAVATLRKVIDGRPTSNLASHADFSPRAVHNVTTHTSDSPSLLRRHCASLLPSHDRCGSSTSCSCCSVRASRRRSSTPSSTSSTSARASCSTSSAPPSPTRRPSSSRTRRIVQVMATTTSLGCHGRGRGPGARHHQTHRPRQPYLTMTTQVHAAGAPLLRAAL